MLHSEIMTIMQERQKVNIMVFDNCGFGCINNLEMNHGIGSLATEFRYTDGKKPTGDLIPVDYAKIGEGYGLKTYTCRTIQELETELGNQLFRRSYQSIALTEFGERFLQKANQVLARLPGAEGPFPEG